MTREQRPKVTMNTDLSREQQLLKKSVEMIKNGHRPRVSVPSDMPEGTVMRPNGSVRLPKSAAACADLLYKTREQRLQLQRQLDRMEGLETALKEYFIDSLPKSKATGIAGRVARVQILPHPIPVVDDWTKFYAYVRRNNAFELLQRRLSESAVKERLDDKKTVPGVGIFQAKKVSCTLIK